MKFLEGLSEDIRKNLLDQLRVLWTHTSTAIEGNTLTLGETAFVLSEGLTIQGKPLKDHRDVQGHARAVDFMMALVNKDKIEAGDLFDLHRLVIDEQVLDFYKPVGDWKKENNSTAVTLGDRQFFQEYSDHREVPGLMERWLELLNRKISHPVEPKTLVRAYARLHVSFAVIHPFWDGNGRIARLVSNLPCLKAGQPPIVIPRQRRFDYLETLATYSLANVVPSRDTPIIQENEPFEAFCALCQESWQEPLSLVENARELQRNREKGLPGHLCRVFYP